MSTVVVFFSPDFSDGGVERTIVTIAKLLTKNSLAPSNPVTLLSERNYLSELHYRSGIEA